MTCCLTDAERDDAEQFCLDCPYADPDDDNWSTAAHPAIRAALALNLEQAVGGIISAVHRQSPAAPITPESLAKLLNSLPERWSTPPTPVHPDRLAKHRAQGGVPMTRWVVIHSVDMPPYRLDREAHQQVADVDPFGSMLGHQLWRTGEYVTRHEGDEPTEIWDAVP
jgi:hypothetical protein